MTRCQIRDHFGGNEIQKIFYKCIFWANEVPEPYILEWWDFGRVLWFTVPCSLLSPHFSQLTVAMISEKTERSGAPTSQNLRGRSAPTSQFLRGRSLWPLKNWEVRRPDLSVSERLAAPRLLAGNTPTSQCLEGQSTLTSQFFKGRSALTSQFFRWS